jgi:2-polyprenyl-3-methyl-5-hydroxy-6-metoxy-1,4-benzoquinol methylase
MLKPGEKAGDVGCGSGQFLLLLSRFTEASYLYGIEITPRLIDNANKLFSTQRPGSYGFSTYDGVHFPEKLQEMDVIYLVDVLHHVPKNSQEAFLKNLSQTLKPGARLVLKDINAASPFVYFNKLHDLIFASEIGNEMSMEQAKKLLQENGLEIIEQSKRRMYVYPHYTIVAKK